MAKPIPKEQLKDIEEVLKAHPEGVSLQFISDALGDNAPRRTLQHRLHYLVEQERAATEGQRRGMIYFPASVRAGAATEAEMLPLSESALDIQKYVLQPLIARKV